jgi:mRNA interferase HigB
MKVIARKALRDFWESRPEYADAAEPLRAWFLEAKKAQWGTPADVKAKYGSASILKDGRVVFNIGGNKYRLVVHINFRAKVVFIRFVGTHRQYDSIDPQTI